MDSGKSTEKTFLPIKVFILNDKDFEGWGSQELQKASFLLSCLKLKKYYRMIKVYVNHTAYKFLNAIRIDFLELIKLESSFSRNDFSTKIYICSEENQPFLFVDNDVYVNDRIESAYPDFDCFFLWKTYNRLENYLNFGERVPVDVLSYNIGILGGSNLHFFKDYFSYLNEQKDTQWQLHEAESEHWLHSVATDRFLKKSSPRIGFILEKPLPKAYPQLLTNDTKKYKAYQIPAWYKKLKITHEFLYQSLPQAYRDNILRSRTIFNYITANYEISRVFLNSYFRIIAADLTNTTTVTAEVKKNTKSSHLYDVFIDVYVFENEINKKIKTPINTSAKPMKQQEKVYTDLINGKDSKITLSLSAQVLKTKYQWNVGSMEEKYLDLIIEYNLRTPATEIYNLLYYDTALCSWNLIEVDILSYACLSLLGTSSSLTEITNRLEEIFFPEGIPSEYKSSFKSKLFNVIINLLKKDIIHIVHY